MGKGNYLDAVKQKLQLNEQLIRSGGLNIKGGPEARDDNGMLYSFSNILTLAENYYDITNGHDAILETLMSFSNTGYTDVSDVRTIGAIDVTIIAMSSSLLPWVAVDRALQDPIGMIFYNDLIAMTDAGGVSSGEVVKGNFDAFNNSVALGLPTTTGTVTNGGSTADVTIDLSSVLVPGSVVVTLDPQGTPKVGRDYASDGKIYFQGSALIASVNYATGVVTVEDATGNLKITASAKQDVTKENGGLTTSRILRVRSQERSVQLITEPNDIIFEQNLHNSMYMSRIYSKGGSVGANIDQTALQFSRITDLYIEFLNRQAVINLIAAEAANTIPTVEISINGYDHESFAITKYDLIQRLVAGIRRAMSTNTGLNPTVLVVGTRAQSEMSTHPTKWISNPGYGVNNNVNGLAGTFDGLPVFVMNYIDSIENSNGSEAFMYGAVKLQDNSSGTLAFGEFLPLTQSPTAANFNNPTQQATAFLSQTGFATIQKSLVVKGRLVL